MSELDDLIAEQARDMRFGDRNQKEHASLEPLEPFLREDGFIRIPFRKQQHPECHIHGRQDLRAHNGNTGWRCAVCFRERAKKWAAAHREVARERSRKWREDNRERRREYEREYKRRRYQNDPEYRARERARINASRSAA